ncbi:MAG TPA: hypothetical protein VE127_12250 [Solirubrobacteraceae bacterium]|nr:hypothetical protein [Solirubrobacteraceae bacterium]
MSDDALIVLLEWVPEFAPRVLDMVAAGDDLPDPANILGEFAAFVSEAATARAAPVALLERCAVALESLATRLDDEDGEELVGWCFFDALAAAARRQLEVHLGPAAAALAACVDGS